MVSMVIEKYNTHIASNRICIVFVYTFIYVYLLLERKFEIVDTLKILELKTVSNTKSDEEKSE